MSSARGSNLEPSREGALADTFVELADTLVDDFDLLEFLHTLTDRCVTLLGVDAAGLLLVDAHGELQAMAATSEQTRQLDLSQLDKNQGPCLDAFHNSTQVVCTDLRREGDRWPRFGAAAIGSGFVGVYAVPMRLRSSPIGALNLFSHHPHQVSAVDLRIAQALADVATLGIMHERAARERQLLVEQLQSALNTRVVVEQAKGVLAERQHIALDAAFDVMRKYARNGNLHLSAIAEAVLANRPDVADLGKPQAAP